MQDVLASEKLRVVGSNGKVDVSREIWATNVHVSFQESVLKKTPGCGATVPMLSGGCELLLHPIIDVCSLQRSLSI